MIPGEVGLLFVLALCFHFSAGTGNQELPSLCMTLPILLHARPVGASQGRRFRNVAKVIQVECGHLSRLTAAPSPF